MNSAYHGCRSASAPTPQSAKEDACRWGSTDHGSGHPTDGCRLHQDAMLEGWMTHDRPGMPCPWPWHGWRVGVLPRSDAVHMNACLLRRTTITTPVNRCVSGVFLHMQALGRAVRLRLCTKLAWGVLTVLTADSVHCTWRSSVSTKRLWQRTNFQL